MKEVIIALSLLGLAVFIAGGAAAYMKLKNVHEEIEEPEDKEKEETDRMLFV